MLTNAERAEQARQQMEQLRVEQSKRCGNCQFKKFRFGHPEWDLLCRQQNRPVQNNDPACAYWQPEQQA